MFVNADNIVLLAVSADELHVFPNSDGRVQRLGHVNQCQKKTQLVDLRNRLMPEFTRDFVIGYQSVMNII